MSMKPLTESRIAALKNRAVKAARVQGARAENLMIDALHAWVSWVNRPSVSAYFAKDNTIGMTHEIAVQIKTAFKDAYDAAHCSRWSRALG